MNSLGVPGVSYRIVLPPGWLLLPVRDRSDRDLRRLITDQYRDLPRDSAGPHIARLADQVVAAISPAREAQVIDVLLPLGTPWIAPISTSIAIAVAAGQFPSGGDLIETEAGEAIREEYEAHDDAIRRVEYLWRIPKSRDQLLLATFSIVGVTSETEEELNEIVDSLTALCDMILATLRWDIDDMAAAPDDTEH